MAPDIIQSAEIIKGPTLGFCNTARAELFINSVLTIFQAIKTMDLARLRYELLKCGYAVHPDHLAVIIQELKRTGHVNITGPSGNNLSGGAVSFSNS